MIIMIYKVSPSPGPKMPQGKQQDLKFEVTMCLSMCFLARSSIAKAATVQLRKMLWALCIVSYACIVCTARKV